MSEVLPRIYLKHLSKITGFSVRPGLCHRGARAWFAQHALDWRDFKTNGIAAEDLLAVGDAFAFAVVEQVQQMERDA